LVDQEQGRPPRSRFVVRALFGVFDAFEDEQVPAALFPRQTKPRCCLPMLVTKAFTR
jgi:hypothetical protein